MIGLRRASVPRGLPRGESINTSYCLPGFFDPSRSRGGIQFSSSFVRFQILRLKPGMLYIAFCGFKKNNIMIMKEATRSHVVLPNIKMEKTSMF